MEIKLDLVVSIHAPARGATSRLANISRHKQSFNPRSREGSDQEIGSFMLVSPKVSIHAPARGATDYIKGYSYDVVVSIHAPARGATRELVPSARDSSVSIHAPARGAT